MSYYGKANMTRRIMLQDAARIRELLNQLGYLVAGGFTQRRLLEMMVHPDQELLVYEYQKEVVGFVSLHFVPQLAFSGELAVISYLAVDQAHRGKGIGAELEAYCTDLAKQRECDRIQLHCAIRRKDAHRFYERQGYRESRTFFTKNLKNS